MATGLNLRSWHENASRLGARLQETISEHTRDLSIARGGASYFDIPEDKVKNIRKELDSSSDREKLDGLRRLIALISKGRNVSEFFPQVVKNVASQNLEVRKLVYIYLLRYAGSEPDTALLSINTFQRDLKDPNPLIRSMALRVLSGMNVPTIANIVLLAIKSCAADISPYVRKAAALAIIKCYSSDSSYLPSLIPILSTLLKDKSPICIGTAALALQSTCPTRLDLLHPNYRGLCKMIVDADEWGQVVLLDLLTRYARTMLSRPTESTEDAPHATPIDVDLKLLLDSSEPLFMSRNPSVILSASRLFYYASPPAHRTKMVNPLLRLLSGSPEVVTVVLANLVLITHTYPPLFRNHYNRFFIRVSDAPPVKKLKIRILFNLAHVDNIQALLKEFVVYAEDINDDVVEMSIRAIGRCARAIPEAVQSCFTSLLDFINYNHSGASVASSVIVLKSLIQTQNPRTSLSSDIVRKIAAKFSSIENPPAKACILWLVGQYALTSQAVSTEDWVPDFLRCAARSFSSDVTIVKLQVLSLAAKALLTTPTQPVSLMAHYIFTSAQFDLDHDIRDRARFLRSLLQSVSPELLSQRGDDAESDEITSISGVVLRREQVKVVLLQEKAAIPSTEANSYASCVLGSLDLVLQRQMGLDASMALPDWLEEGVDPSLRGNEESEQDIFVPSALSLGHNSLHIAPISGTVGLLPAQQARQTATASTLVDLDKFYEEETDGTTSEDDTESEEAIETQHRSSSPQDLPTTTTDEDSDSDSS